MPIVHHRSVVALGPAKTDKNLTKPENIIWNPVPVRIYWWFVTYQAYDMNIFSENFMLAYTWDMTWISKIKMFVHGIRTAIATAVPCSLRTATEGRKNILRDDDFHSG